ncbi:DUF4082 domain-containing protein [Candidatus Saccharibacteria bacterium]|nr:DUF4082 domain-containing protein [Candidatus Saccharibacteria bacterium]
MNPNASLSPETVYTVQVSTGVKDANGVALASAYSSSFTTGANVFSLWAPQPQTVSAAADNDVELGLKFASSQNGSVKAITFYKSPADTLTSHTVTLWDAAGAPLGTATTGTETASGWQTATFATPIAITANATYTASYRSTAGHYSYTAGGLNAAFTNGPLTAQAGGGVFRYGGGFPESSFNGNNYWVDVVMGE